MVQYISLYNFPKLYRLKKCLCFDWHSIHNFLPCSLCTPRFLSVAPCCVTPGRYLRLKRPQKLQLPSPGQNCFLTSPKPRHSCRKEVGDPNQHNRISDRSGWQTKGTSALQWQSKITCKNLANTLCMQNKCERHQEVDEFFPEEGNKCWGAMFFTDTAPLTSLELYVLLSIEEEDCLSCIFHCLFLWYHSAMELELCIFNPAAGLWELICTQVFILI